MNKLRIGFLVIIALFWAISIYALLGNMTLRDSFVHLDGHVYPMIIEMGEMNTQLNEVREVTLAYILLGDSSDGREVFREQLEELYHWVGQFAARHLAHENVVGSQARKDSEELASLSEGLVLTSTEIVSLKDKGAEYSQLSEKMDTDFEPVFWSLKGLLDGIIVEHQEELVTAEAKVANQHDSNIRIILIFSIIATLAAVVVAIIVDRLFLKYLTRHKELEDALRQRAEEWDRITNAIEDFVSVQDRDFRFISVNKALCKALKTRPEDLLGKKCHEVLHKTDLPWLSCPMVEVFKDGKTHTTEVEDPNLGTTLLVTASPIFDEKGEVVAGVHIAKDISERKKMEKVLQESEAKWRSMAENSPDIVMLVDLDGSIQFINRTIAGLKRNEVIGSCVYDYIPDKYKSMVKECHQRVLKTGNSGQYETDYQTSDGETLHFEARVGAVRESGKIVGITVSTRDVTDRRKMERVLEKESHSLGERVKELGCLYGLSTLVEKQHITLEEILEGALNLIPPGWQYPEITCARILLGAQTFKSKNFKETHWKLTSDIVVHGKKTGLLEVVYLKEKPESDEGPFLKEERHLINALSERLGRIIERKEVERELRIKSEAIESSINAIALADLEGRLTYVNRSFLSMWKRSRQEEVLGRPIAEFWGTREQSLQIMQAVRSGKGWTGELVAKREDGSSLDVQLMVNIVENTVGKAICMVASVVDITERKRIEQMKDDFVALASHELRTPLTSIQGYAELILDGDVGEISREQREFLEIISQNTRRLEALINDVLDVEKIESGRMTMKMEKTDLGPIVDNCFNTFKVMAEGKGLKLERDVKTSPINVLGDSDRLSQVFSNLLSNAIKYTKEGKVKIIASIKGEFASVAVEDTGLGMSPEDMKIVFSRFFRAEDSYVRKTTGSGLGLSIAKATIERHNGDIKVESKLGAGSKFEVILPLFKENEGAGQ